MKYHVTINVNITPYTDDDKLAGWSGNSLYHSQAFDIGGLEVTKFSQIAPTIDGLYDAVHSVVEAYQNDQRGDTDPNQSPSSTGGSV